jgi:hypothetical protein
MLKKILPFIAVLVLIGCKSNKPVSQVQPVNMDMPNLTEVKGYKLLFEPSLIFNAMPLANENNEQYIILKLTEIEGKNIQFAFGLQNVILVHSGQSDTLKISEIHDFGLESPIIEGVVRGLKVPQTLDVVTLEFAEFNSGVVHKVSYKNVRTFTAY